MPPRRRRVLPSIVLVAALAATVGARQDTLVRDHPGVWRPRALRLAEELTPAERTTATQVIERVLAVLRRAPLLATLKGFDAVPNTSATVLRPGGGRGAEMIDYELSVGLAAYERTSTGVAANDGNPPAVINIAINRLDMIAGGTVTSGDIDFGDDQGDFVKGMPEVVETRHGAPVYEAGNDRWIVFRRAGLPLFAGVSRGRYLDYRLRAARSRLQRGEQNLARINASDPMMAGPLATLREALDRLRHEIASLQQTVAALAPADRDAASWIAADPPFEAPQFAPAGTDAAEPIVDLNPALFTGAARSTPCVLAIAITTDTDHWPDLAAALDAGIDWEAIAAIVRKSGSAGI